MINKNRISWRSISVLKTIYRATGEQFELNVEISLGLDLFFLIRLWLFYKFIFLLPTQSKTVHSPFHILHYVNMM